MNEAKIKQAINFFSGMDKESWLTIRNSIDYLFEKKTIEAGIALNGLEVTQLFKAGSTNYVGKKIGEKIADRLQSLFKV